MAQKTKAEFNTLIANNLPNNTTGDITPAKHREVAEAVKDSFLILNSDNLGSGGTATSGQFLKYDGTNWVTDTPAGGGSITWTATDKTDATAVNLANGNNGYHWEVTGNVAPTFNTAAGTTSGNYWKITNSNANQSTVITIAEGASTTSNFGGDIKLMPGQTMEIIHQGSDRFVYSITDNIEIIKMGFIASYDGAGAWSLIDDADHKPFYMDGLSASCSVVSSSPNYLKIEFSTTDANHKIITASIDPDEETMGLAVGYKIEQTSTTSEIRVNFGALRPRRIDGYCTWSGSAWTWSNAEGDVNPTVSTGTATSIILALPAGETRNLKQCKVSNSATTYWVKPNSSIGSNINLVISDTSGSSITPTSGDRVFVEQDLYGRAENRDFDADDLIGVTVGGNIWGSITLQRSKF